MKIIRLAIRSLMHFRVYTLVNIVGLGLSLACFMLICRFVYSEAMTDHYIDRLDQLYITAWEAENTRATYMSSWPDYVSPNPLHDKDVECITVFYNYGKSQISVGDISYSVNSFAVDSNYLKLITLPILRQSKPNLFHGPGDAVVSEELALRIFGHKDPLGETIISSKGDMLTVVGVFGRPKGKVSLLYDMLESSTPEDSKVVASQSFALLNKNVDIKAFNKRYDKYQKTGDDESRYRLKLMPYKDLYWDSDSRHYFDQKLEGRKTDVLLLSAMALFLFVIGLFNFINVYTVLMLKRGREFGMKKVFGANGRQVAIQIYTENLVMVAAALLLSWAFVEIGTLFVRQYTTLMIFPYIRFDLLLSLGILFLLPLITGIYPFLRYNYSRPITSLRSVNRGGGMVISRSFFLCAQYVVTMVLVLCSLFFIRQLNYMLNADIGYNTKNIIHTSPINSPSGKDMAVWTKYLQGEQYLRTSLKDSPLFTNYAFIAPPMDYKTSSYDIRVPGGKPKSIQFFWSNERYFNMLKVKLIEGRLWDDTRDQLSDFTVIINESAKRELEITDLENATITIPRFNVYSSSFAKDAKPEYRVIGVIEDFHTGHLSKKKMPMAFQYFETGPHNGILIEITPGKKQEAITYLSECYKEISGDGMSYSFLEDRVKALYDEDKQLTQFLTFFAVIAILISSMGLFSLSLFDIQERFHEVAIRKVNGASSATVVHLLLRKYYLLLGIAFLIAMPVSGLLITKYLEGFAYKASFAWWLFAVALLLTAVISLFTLIYQIRKAAGANPAEVIRSE